MSEAYLEPSQTSKKEYLARVVHVSKSITISKSIKKSLESVCSSAVLEMKKYGIKKLKGTAINKCCLVLWVGVCKNL